MIFLLSDHMSGQTYVVFVLGISIVILASCSVADKSLALAPLTNFTFFRNIPSDPTSETQIFEPEGVELDSERNLYVNDIQTNSIKKFTSDGNFILSWGSTGSDDGQFNHPHGNQVDLNGKIYITDQNNARVQKFTTDGKFILKWGSHGTADCM